MEEGNGIQNSIQELSNTGQVPDTPITIPIHSLTAKLFLNRPMEELIPSEYLQKADDSWIPDIVPWVFDCDDSDGRTKNVFLWSSLSDHFMSLFGTLKQVPNFDHPLYEGGSEFAEESFEEDAFNIQRNAIDELLEEVLGLMYGTDRALRRDIFCHLSYRRCLSADMNYLTGLKERHYDAPMPSGFLTLKLNGPRKQPHYVIPVSTTQKSEPFPSAIAGKIKMMLSQLYLSMRARKCKADQLPDQEVFLIGLHGSRLHILRAFFPGEKSSTIWSGRYSPQVSATPNTSATTSTVGSAEKVPAENSSSSTTQESANHPSNHKGIIGTETNYYSYLDSEPNLRTFRVLATREFNLWNRSDFHAAIKAIVALNLYLMSGFAQIGPIQAILEPFPTRLRVAADGLAEKREKGVFTEICEDDDESDEEELTGESKIMRWLGLKY